MKVETKANLNALGIAASGILGAMASDLLVEKYAWNPLYAVGLGVAVAAVGWYLDHTAGMYLLGAGLGLAVDGGLRYFKVI